MIDRRSIVAGAASASILAINGVSDTPAAAPSALKGGGLSMDASQLAPLALPVGVRSRFIENVNGLKMHVLEAGFETPGRPAILLLHGFPDLAYSWRKTLLPLAEAGYHVIAPDQRGYGRTTGWDSSYDGDVPSFRTHNYALDALSLISAMGLPSVRAVVGHDFGSMIAAYCALVRPDVFRSVVLMSLPFDNIPVLPFGVADQPALPKGHSLAEQLAALPRPRKDSMAYFSSPAANADMLHAPQGLQNFLRAYFYVKSADWTPNTPYPLPSDSASELAKIPTYYIMDLDKTMPQSVKDDMPSAAQIAEQHWLSDQDLAVYTSEYERTGFQGGLNWFRCHSGSIGHSEIELFAGRTIDVPASFISGRADWGVYRKPGAVDRMQTQACTRFEGVHLIDGAGHWVQQERAESFNALLTRVLAQLRNRT